jgi:phosphatidylinositol alpha-mannosyltransferase
VKVALLNPTFWPEVERGSERIMAQLARDLAARGHEPRVVTSHRGRPGTSTEYGYPVTRVARPPERLLGMRGFQPHLTHVPFSYAALSQGRYDLAHAFYPTDAAATTRWAGRTGRPSVFSYMGVPRREVLAARRLSLALVSNAVNQSSEVVALSKAAADGMHRWLGKSARVIYPGADLELFTPGGSRAPEPTIACGAATEDGRKRVDLLARAFRLVRRNRPDARLLLAKPRGMPGLADQLSAICEGIEFYEGPPAKVAEVFRSAWISALTSYQEAFGLVLVESLACGTPVVGTRDGGIPEIVDRPEVGRLFDGDGEEAVAQALLEALELSQQSSTATNCRTRAQRFSTARCAADHVELYRELLAAT